MSDETPEEAEVDDVPLEEPPTEEPPVEEAEQKPDCLLYTSDAADDL